MKPVDGVRPSFAKRALAFARQIWGVLREPSSVFSLGSLIFAGFVAGIVFWGGSTQHLS